MKTQMKIIEFTKVGKDLQDHAVQPPTYHQYFPTIPCPSVLHLNTVFHCDSPPLDGKNSWFRYKIYLYLMNSSTLKYAAIIFKLHFSTFFFFFCKWSDLCQKGRDWKVRFILICACVFCSCLPHPGIHRKLLKLQGFLEDSSGFILCTPLQKTKILLQIYKTMAI